MLLPFYFPGSLFSEQYLPGSPKWFPGGPRRNRRETVSGVVVAGDRRGEGLGERLLAALVDHPDRQGLPGRSLSCRRGLVSFYGAVDFEEYGGEVDVPGAAPRSWSG
jgi:GNAT superfamily N-acetyltransferase